MAHRNTIRAKQIREELLDKLGAKCALCPCSDRDQLQFDHEHGSDWVLNKLSYLQRMNLYLREYAEKKLRLLCKKCNRDTRVPDDKQGWQRTAYAGVDRERIPF